jgi:Anti-sigma factor NepR
MKQSSKPTKGNDGQMKNGMQLDRKEPVLGELVQSAIGRSLKAHFDDIANAPVPDKFLALLAELEAKESGRDK